MQLQKYYQKICRFHKTKWTRLRRVETIPLYSILVVFQKWKLCDFRIFIVFGALARHFQGFENLTGWWLDMSWKITFWMDQLNLWIEWPGTAREGTLRVSWHSTVLAARLLSLGNKCAVTPRVKVLNRK